MTTAPIQVSRCVTSVPLAPTAQSKLVPHSSYSVRVARCRTQRAHPPIPTQLLRLITCVRNLAGEGAQQSSVATTGSTIPPLMCEGVQTRQPTAPTRPIALRAPRAARALPTPLLAPLQLYWVVVCKMVICVAMTLLLAATRALRVSFAASAPHMWRANASSTLKPPAHAVPNAKSAARRRETHSSPLRGSCSLQRRPSS